MAVPKSTIFLPSSIFIILLRERRKEDVSFWAIGREDMDVCTKKHEDRLVLMGQNMSHEMYHLLLLLYTLGR